MRDHVKKVKEWYGKVPAVVTYDKLREMLKTAEAVPAGEAAWQFWDEMAQAVDMPKSKLVIAKILERWRRPPTGEELKKMYEEIFKLPMSGKLVLEGEVQNG